MVTGIAVPTASTPLADMVGAVPMNRHSTPSCLAWLTASAMPRFGGAQPGQTCRGLAWAVQDL
jgi:hypothetical protein